MFHNESRILYEVENIKYLLGVGARAISLMHLSKFTNAWESSFAWRLFGGEIWAALIDFVAWERGGVNGQFLV
jgi:hypothetical protein